MHFRTASVIDEAGGARRCLARRRRHLLAAHDTITTSACSRTVGGGRRALTNPYGGGSNILTEVACHQDYRGNRPLPMLINVWNMRFIEGQEIGDEPPMVQAQLAHAPDEKSPAASPIVRRSR